MGFPHELAESVLIRHAWDEHAALIDLLVGGGDYGVSKKSDEQSRHTSCTILEEERVEASESGEESEDSDWTSISVPNSP